MHKVSRGS